MAVWLFLVTRTNLLLWSRPEFRQGDSPGLAMPRTVVNKEGEEGRILGWGEVQWTGHTLEVACHFVDM